MEIAKFFRHISLIIALFTLASYGETKKTGIKGHDMDNVFKSLLGRKSKKSKKEQPDSAPGISVEDTEDEHQDVGSQQSFQTVKPHHQTPEKEESLNDEEDDDLDLGDLNEEEEEKETKEESSDEEEAAAKEPTPKAASEGKGKGEKFQTLDEILLGLKEKPVNPGARKNKPDDGKSLEDALEINDDDMANEVEDDTLDSAEDEEDEKEEEEEEEEDDDDDDDGDDDDGFKSKLKKAAKSKLKKGAKKISDKLFGKHGIPGVISNIFPSDIKGHSKFGNNQMEGELKRLSEENRRLKESVDRSYYERMFRPETDVTDAEGRLNPGLAAAMRYLGSGYDIIYGNPLGDPVIMVDPGYRHPVLRLDWSEKYYNNDGANMKEPKGGWIRPELSCRQSESVDHINTMDDYKKELSVDAKMSADMPLYFSFSASAGYKNMVRTLATNETKNYILKTYCLRYVAGIQDFLNIEPTESFVYDVSQLPEKFHDGECLLEVYRNDPEDEKCASVVRPWMKFFQKYGTHFTTVIHLGGKVTNQIQIDKKDVAKLQKDGYNIDVMIKSGSISPVKVGGGFSHEKKEESSSNFSSLQTEKLVIVIGGDVPTDGTDKTTMLEWTKSLYRKPMPIKVNIESIKTLIDGHEKKKSFDTALKYYSEAYGISPEELYRREGRKMGIAGLARYGTPVTYYGTTGGSAVCPNGKVIMMGFSVVISSWKATVFSKPQYTISMTPCPIGQEKCMVSVPPGAEGRVWILCGSESIPLLIQETKVANNEAATAQCPDEYAIAFGFGLSIPDGAKLTPVDCYACRAGQKSCTQASPKSPYNAVWIACVEKNAPELGSIVNQARVSLSAGCSSKLPQTTADNICPVGTLLIAGWEMNHSLDSYTGIHMIQDCNHGYNGCKFEKSIFGAPDMKCRSQHSWISCVKHEVIDAYQSGGSTLGIGNSGNSVIGNITDANPPVTIASMQSKTGPPTFNFDVKKSLNASSK